MKKTISEMLVSISIFIIGLCLLIWAEKVTNLVSQIFGAILIIYGIITFILYLTSEERRPADIVYAIVLLVIGVILVAKPSIITEIISFIIGIYIIMSSILSISKTLDNKENNNFNLVLGLSITALIIGVLCTLGKLLIPNVILQFVGLLLVIYSVINIINTLLLPKN